MTALRVEGLYKIYGPQPRRAADRLRDGASADDVRATGATPAVAGVDLAVEPGEIFVVMGLSGSGKSTLLRMLNGLLEPTAGTVHLGDAEITALRGKRLRELRQQRISMVFQHFALLPHRTVLENAAYALEVRGVDRRTRNEAAREALAMVGLDGMAERRPDELSGGMQQRVGLARALAAGSDLLLMDEAFSALDPLIRREMQDQLLELQARLNKTIVFITHDLNEAMRLGDRIAIMRDGRIVRLGTPESILADPGDEYVQRFLADVDRSRVFTAADVVRPAPVVRTDVGPEEALEALRDRGAEALVVVDAEGRLVGVATAPELLAADGDVTAAVRPPAARVSATTSLSDLLGPAGAGEAPVAVVDDEGRPSGLVDARAVLAALAGTASDTGAAEAARRPELLGGPRG